MGSNHDPVRSASRILLCEHDIHTGKTLNELKAFLERLGPEKVDVSFWVDIHRGIKHYFDTQDFYDEHFLVKNMPTDHLIENLNAAVEYAKQDKTRLMI